MEADIEGPKVKNRLGRFVDIRAALPCGVRLVFRAAMQGNLEVAS